MFQALATSMLIACGEGLLKAESEACPDVPGIGLDRPCF
jgi:hypothetical protein